jgi:multidrug efflux pump subunit AcrA (membrane-fusion protein)
MKKFIQNSPDGAKQLLTDSPQVAQTLLQILCLYGLVRPADIQAMHSRGEGDPHQGPAHGLAHAAPHAQQQQLMIQQQQAAAAQAQQAQQQAAAAQQQQQAQAAAQAQAEQQRLALIDQQRQQQQLAIEQQQRLAQQQRMHQAHAMPQAPIQNVAAALPPEQQALLQQVLKLSPEQIRSLPPTAQQQIKELQAQMLARGIHR